MRITYDPEGDALYILLREETPTDSTDIGEGVTAYLDDGGHIIGLEVLDASKRLTRTELNTFTYENLLLAPRRRIRATQRSS